MCACILVRLLLRAGVLFLLTPPPSSSTFPCCQRVAVSEDEESSIPPWRMAGRGGDGGDIVYVPLNQHHNVADVAPTAAATEASTDPWAKALQDFYVTRRLALYRRSQCAVSGHC